MKRVLYSVTKYYQCLDIIILKATAQNSISIFSQKLQPLFMCCREVFQLLFLKKYLHKGPVDDLAGKGAAVQALRPESSPWDLHSSQSSSHPHTCVAAHASPQYEHTHKNKQILKRNEKLKNTFMENCTKNH